MALVLPRFIVINFNDNDEKDNKRHYMGYINEKGKDYNGYLAFTETQAVSAYAKFKVETANRNGLVHIRSSQNNKYWLQTKENNNRGDFARITATAENLENDQCKVSCTLFKFIIEDAATNMYRIVHIQSGCYLSSKWRASNFPCFVGANDKTCQGTFMMSNMIWRIQGADSNENSNNNKHTLFHPIKVDYQTIGLLNLGNNHFYKCLTIEGKKSCLNAATPTVTKEAKLKVEEHVLIWNIYDVKYDMENSRVYGETVLVVAKNSAINNTQQTSNLDVKLSYTNTRTSNWKTMLYLKLGMKATMDFSIPLIFYGKIEIFGEVQSGVEWGEITTTTTVLKVVHKVVVAPMSKMTVSLIATNGKCDSPFTFMQKDTLYNGNIITTEVQCGTYTGSNFYSIKFETKQDKI
ncbi:natterin-3-like [Dioscorea cayenensis subsp. rotundata]|uniref:Natterin-3-like n=1 Tax=Dioscorea cayennensis subsp. rotundata TaxID=55577 RepID=A0AB40C0Q2_DIOCR|nr:natterin-3-like [Dioscorea cayenensis subsp. rotundata]